MSSTIDRLRILISDVTYDLAPVEHLDDVKAAMTQALRAGGGFVDLTLDNGRRLSFLVTIASVVIIVVETLRLDSGAADGEDTQTWGDEATMDHDGDTSFDII